MTSKSETRRRWFQFSLKSIFVVMLVVATFFGGMAVQRRQSEKAMAANELARANQELKVLEFLQQSVSTAPANPSPPSPVTSGGDPSAE